MTDRYKRIFSILAWATAAFFVFFQFFLQTASSVMSEAWTRDFHLNKIELSNLSATFFYSYVLLQIPVGILYDRFKVKHVLIVAATLLACGCILLSVTHSYELALIARFLMGSGSAFGFVGLLKVIITNFNISRFGLMLGLAELFGMAGVTLGVIALTHFMLDNSWRTAMLWCGVLAGIVILAVILFVQDDNKLDIRERVSITILSQVKTVLMNKQVILCSLYGFFIYSIITAFTSLWGIAFLANTYHLDEALASKMISAVFVGLALGSPLNGFLSKKYGNNAQMMRWEAGCATLLISIIILVPAVPVILLFLLLFLMGCLCSVYVQCLSVVKDSVHLDVQATALATSNMLIMASAPILQLIIGAFLQSNFGGMIENAAENYRVSLAVLPAGYLFALIISMFIKDPVVITE